MPTQTDPNAPRNGSPSPSDSPSLERITADADHVLPMHDGAVYERYPDGVR